jgi:sigma-B regulation protein RsbU (phosphoserine phosphatase)
VMMMTQTAILSLVRQDPALGPAGVFQAVNGILWENISRLGGSRYMTLNVVRLDDEGLMLAGRHQDILVWRQGAGRVEVATNDGCWIGVLPAVEGLSPERFIRMGVGDTALFFTDGVTEARCETGEMYGEDRLASAFARAAERPPAEVIRSILSDVALFTTEQTDDMTLVLVRRVTG